MEYAFKKARRHKTLKPYVIEFEEHLDKNLAQLRTELLFHTYKPRPLETFILRDPKTRKISKSDFRDRVIHHALCNIIEPLFDKKFIYDSYANRLGKGSINAIKRFEHFARKTSKNNTRDCFVLKADIKHYFDNVDHEVLISILQRKVKDDRILWLIRTILNNHKSTIPGKGMPLGNLTSQFFANVYLNELDQYIKHDLKAKYYSRYVDDFVILDTSQSILQSQKKSVDDFLKMQLLLELHPEKSKVITLENGVSFLGFRIFFYHKLLRKKNLLKFEKKFNKMTQDYKKDKLPRESAVEKFEGWLTYASHANTYKYRRHITRQFNKSFPLEETTIKLTSKKEENLNKKITISTNEFTVQKTLQLLRKGKTAKDIATLRGIKEGTVWSHFANLIEYNQCKPKAVLPKETIQKIQAHIHSENDNLKDIHKGLNDPRITMDEINCVLANIKLHNKQRSLPELITWFQHIKCKRMCKQEQRQSCEEKFQKFITTNPTLQFRKKEFLDFFHNHLRICILPEKKKKHFRS
ncbi:MAG: helix-turn-helix domain-containing protein [Nanoarchaeota archaeon]|nr:helix-turn-helix domain-containing protein [Nanoarchaeota archaeon]MBU1975888.1 helix-turn-helix domain-containing protein [Nanoarchaeota archaeon]